MLVMLKAKKKSRGERSSSVTNSILKFLLMAHVQADTEILVTYISHIFAKRCQSVSSRACQKPSSPSAETCSHDELCYTRKK